MRFPDACSPLRLALMPGSAAGLVLLLCACGQSGDLYLPDRNAPAASSSAAPAGAAGEEEERKRKEAEQGHVPDSAESAAPLPPATTSPTPTAPTSP